MLACFLKMYENMMHLQAGKISLLYQGLFRLAAEGLNTLPSSEEACSKEGIDWNKVLLQTHADVLAAKIAGLSVKINTQELPNGVFLPLVWDPFSETKRKYKIFSKIDAAFWAASRLCRNREYVLLCVLEQVQEILVYLIQNST